MLLKLFRFYLLKKGIISRGLLCWAIGIISFFSTQSGTYDYRFKIRNRQQPDPQILIVQLSEEEWESVLRSYQISQPQKGLFISRPDTHFWDASIWSRALNRILDEKPKVIGVNLIFSELEQEKLTPAQQKTFTNPKVIWAAALDSQGSPKIPFFVDPIHQRQALINFNTSDDGVLRVAPYHSYPLTNMSEAITQSTTKNYKIPGELKNYTINYAGPAESYLRISFRDIALGLAPNGIFKDKIVLIGSPNSRHHSYLTPMGHMSQSEVIANAVDTLVNNKSITHIKAWPTILFLGLLVLLCIYINLTYPHELSGIMLLGVSISITAFSLWLFDTFYYWTPIVAPVITVTACFIFFLSLQLTLKENQAWRLEQEQKYFYEVKQLKDNFISLISHDLKTPIAKIQAIIDRIRVEHDNPHLSADLALLRGESVELHRYIQSILSVLRVEATDFKINKDACDINKIIKNVVKQLTPLAKSKDLQLEMELEPLFLVDLDNVLIHEVILNLIENAIKYSKEGGYVRVMSTEVDEQVIVVVEDSGAGISKDEQEKIFEKFHRGKEHSFHTKGSGLGLYLVKYFIELHGGEVFLESEIDKGTTVGFSLPVNDNLEKNT